MKDNAVVIHGLFYVFEFRIFLLLNWLPPKFGELCLFCYLSYSQKKWWIHAFVNGYKCESECNKHDCNLSSDHWFHFLYQYLENRDFCLVLFTILQKYNWSYVLFYSFSLIASLNVYISQWIPYRIWCVFLIKL